MVTGVYNRLDDTVLSSYTYTYDTVGNQTSKTDHTGKSITYIYDGLGRLESELNYSTGESVDYFYDASQNRSSMYVDNGDESYYIYYTYDANNRLTQERKYQDGTYTTIATYTYDDNGNLLTKTGADGAAAYTYNGFNQQTGYTVGTTASAYAYNAKGIRTAKTIGTDRTSYLLDGGNVVTEVKNNAVSANYIRGTNLISKEADNSTSYYLYNAHGDVIGLTNNTGSVTKAYDYDAFGIEKNPNAADTNPFRYCGEYYDTETGKYYLRARYYDPSLGRFTQADSVQYVHRELPNGASIIDPLSLNLYAYSANNPIKYCDPSGNAFEVVLDVISVVDSAVTFAIAPTPGNALMLMWDIGGALIPFVPGSYVAKGAKMLTKADDFVDGAKLVLRADDVADVTKLIDDAADAGVTLTKISEDASSKILAENMKNAGRGIRAKGQAAHHIVAGNSKGAMEARSVLRKFGIGINSAANGVYLPTVKGASNAAYHNTLHTDKYFEAVNKLLKQATTKEEALKYLKQIENALLNNTFPH